MNFTPIILVIIISYILSITKRRQNKLLVVGLISILTITTATRSIKVPDTEEYIESFLYNTDFFNFDVSQYEKGYTLFMRFFHFLFLDNYALYFALFPLINFFLISKACRILFIKVDCVKNNRIFSTQFNIYTILVTYFSFFGLYHNAIVLRAGIATSIVFLSLAYCFKAKSKKEYFEAFACMLVAFFFHSSTILCLPMYYIVLRTKSYKKSCYQLVLLVIFIIYILSPYLDGLMSPLNQLFLLIGNSDYSEISKYEFYNSSSTINYSGISFKFLFFYTFGWFFTSICENNEVWGRLLSIYILGLFIWAIFRPVLLVERITDFYLFLYVFMASMFFSPHRIKRVIPKLLIFASLIQIAFIYRIINS